MQLTMQDGQQPLMFALPEVPKKWTVQSLRKEGVRFTHNLSGIENHYQAGDIAFSLVELDMMSCHIEDRLMRDETQFPIDDRLPITRAEVADMAGDDDINIERVDFHYRLGTTEEFWHACKAKVLALSPEAYNVLMNVLITPLPGYIDDEGYWAIA